MKFFSDMKNTSDKIQEKLTSIRKKIQALIDERKYYESSHLPIEEVFQKIDTAISECLARGERAVEEWSRPSAKISLLDNISGGLKSEYITQALANEIGKGLKAQAEKLNHEPGPSSAERPALIEAVNAQLKKLAIEEEQLIMGAQDQGFMIKRRADFDPAVVLEFE